jgi:hypothetical protein
MEEGPPYVQVVDFQKKEVQQLCSKVSQYAQEYEYVLRESD